MNPPAPVPPPLPPPGGVRPAEFAPGPVSLVAGSLLTGLCILVALQDGRENFALVWRDAGEFAVGLLLSLGGAWLARRCLPRRRAGGVAFCLLLLLLTMGRISQRLVSAMAASRHEAQMRRYKRQMHQVEEEALAARHQKKAGEDDGLPYQPATLAQGGVDLLHRAAGDMRGDDRKIVEAEARVLGILRDKARAFELATASLQAAGWVSGAGLDGREAIALRRTLVKNYADSNRAMGDACRNIEGIIREEMRRELPDAAAERGLRLALSGMHLESSVRMRDLEARRVEAFDGLLALYDAQFPRWRLDAYRRVVLEDAAAQAQQQRWRQQIADVEAGETRLLQEVVASHRVTPGPSPPR